MQIRLALLMARLHFPFSLRVPVQVLLSGIVDRQAVISSLQILGHFLAYALGNPKPATKATAAKAVQSFLHIVTPSTPQRRRPLDGRLGSTFPDCKLTGGSQALHPGL
ncbi:MAG: hypothetical protein E6J59_14830 [Deltaproteobacteria bacterium]|nr:MAG: hypothetical protein E6J59_14830 [Deltaproteobacteria bacterium]